jgi:hypothetical protein
MTKDITIKDVRYQMGEFTARDGSWVVGQFLARGLIAGLGSLDESKEPIERSIALMLSLGFTQLDENVYNSIQNKCLSVIKRYEGDTAVPLLMANGAGWTSGKEPDAITLSTLVMATMAFNFVPFFDPGVLETLRTVYPNLKALSL